MRSLARPSPAALVPAQALAYLHYTTVCAQSVEVGFAVVALYSTRVFFVPHLVLQTSGLLAMADRHRIRRRRPQRLRNALPRCTELWRTHSP